MWILYLFLFIGICVGLYYAISYISSTSGARREGRELDEDIDNLEIRREVMDKKFTKKGLEKVLKGRKESLKEFSNMD